MKKHVFKAYAHFHWKQTIFVLKYGGLTRRSWDSVTNMKNKITYENTKRY